MKQKQAMAIAHRILGMIVGVFIIIISLTGSILVFDKEVNPILHLHTHQVVPQTEQIALQQVASSINQQFPQSQLDWLTIPGEANEPYHALIKFPDKSKTDIYINPYSGELLGSYPRDRAGMRIVNQLHTHLLAGKFGSFIVGVCGLLLLVLSITGLMLWNGWKKLSVGFKIRWQAKWQILHYDLHKVGGVLTAVFLVLIATSGSMMVFDKPIKNLGYWLTHQARIEKPVSLIFTHSQSLSLDQFLNIAINAFPEGKPTVLYTAKDSQSPVRVRFKLPHEIAPEGKSFILLDQYSGAVLQVENFFHSPVIERVKAWADALHTGTYGGLGMMAVYIVVGFVSSALSVTGFVIWWGRSFKRKVAPRFSQSSAKG
ncbi:MAG: PepSY domain-containing protein [Nostoc sp. LLA-1]|nr:PepSY domain-containing protein [Cyanocohniella sp. LLY]